VSRRRILLLIWKEFLELSRDRLLLPVIIVMPLLQLFMFGYVVSSDVRDIPTAVIDHDLTPASRQVVDAFANSGYFRIVARGQDESGMKALMDASRAQVVLIVPPGFGDLMLSRLPAPVEVVVDGSESKTSQVAQGYAQSILAAESSRLLPLPPGAPTPPKVPKLDVRVRVLFNPGLRSVDSLVPGLIAFILLLSVTLLTSQAVVKERERGTLEQMFVTPITRAEFLVGKMLPYGIIATVQVAVVFTVGTLWFGVPFRGSLAVVAVGALLFLLAGIGQGLIISTLSRNRYQAQVASMFIIIPSFLLSGFVFPLESMPRPVYLITYLIPLRYFLVVLRSSFMKGTGFGPLAPQLFAMAAFSAVIFGAALLRFRKKLAD
jgi:ABC-2 type transport system permease protein